MCLRCVSVEALNFISILCHIIYILGLAVLDYIYLSKPKMNLDEKYKFLYDNSAWLGRVTSSIIITPGDFFKGLEISRLVVIPVKGGRGVPTIQAQSIFIAHAETAGFPGLPKGMKIIDGFVYAPLHFKTVDCDDSGKKTHERTKAKAEAEGRGVEVEEEEEEGRGRSRSRSPPPKCAFSRITNSDGVIQVGYLELFQAVQEMFLPRSLKHREDYALRGNNPHADDFREVKSVIDVLNGAMDSGRNMFASKLKPHLEASRGSENLEIRKQAILLTREINRDDGFYDAGPTIQEGRLSTMTLGGDPYYLENKALRNDEYFDKTVYNVLVTVKVVTRSNMYFIYFYISRRKILDFLRGHRKSITEEDSISFWIGEAMEFINSPGFIAVITDIIRTSVGQGGAGTRSDSTKKVITDLLPFLDIRVRHGSPADYHCSIDSGCKLFAFVDIKEKDGSPVIKNYTRLGVPDSNYLPNDFVVGFDDKVQVPYVLTRPFTALGRHDWNGIVIGSNRVKFQLPKYSDVRLEDVIGGGQGDSMDSLRVEPSDSLRVELDDPVEAAVEAAVVEAATVAASAEAAVAASAEAAVETRVTPSLISKTKDYVVRMINYFFTSPKIGDRTYDETFISGLIKILDVGVSIHTLEEKQRYISTDNEIYQESREALTGRGGRGCKLLKRTKKQKRGSRSRSRRSRRGSRRRRSRKN